MAAYIFQYCFLLALPFFGSASLVLQIKFDIWPAFDHNIYISTISALEIHLVIVAVYIFRPVLDVEHLSSIVVKYVVLQVRLVIENAIDLVPLCWYFLFRWVVPSDTCAIVPIVSCFGVVSEHVAPWLFPCIVGMLPPIWCSCSAILTLALITLWLFWDLCSGHAYSCRMHSSNSASLVHSSLFLFCVFPVSWSCQTIPLYSFSCLRSFFFYNLDALIKLDQVRCVLVVLFEILFLLLALACLAFLLLRYLSSAFSLWFTSSGSSLLC